MRRTEAWLVGLLLIAAGLLLPMAALEPVRLASLTGAAGACDDGSAHLAMGCASILL